MLPEHIFEHIFSNANHATTKHAFRCFHHAGLYINHCRAPQLIARMGELPYALPDSRGRIRQIADIGDFLTTRVFAESRAEPYIKPRMRLSQAPPSKLTAPVS